MPEPNPKSAITIRDLKSFEDLSRAQALEKEIWELSDLDVMPLTTAIAIREAGSIWLGAFDGAELVGFAFGFLGMEHGEIMVHSHVLGVRGEYRDSDLGYKLKLAQRERALAMRVQQMTWTFDPLQSKNAHLNFNKLGVVADTYKVDFYGPETSSSLHRNGTDRLWVKWPLTSRRVQARLQGKSNRAEVLDLLPCCRWCSLMGTANRNALTCLRLCRVNASRLRSRAILGRLKKKIRRRHVNGVWRLVGRLAKL